MSTVAVSISPTRALAWRDLVALLKLRIGALVVLTATCSAVAAGNTRPGSLAVLALACLAASCGASALNHYLDRDLDSRMARTRARPLPSGRVRNPRVALVLGIGLVALSQVAFPVLGAGPALYLLAGALTYAVVYTAWLKPRTPYSIVLGGAAGSFAALAGWQTAASTWEPTPLLLAAVLFLWTPSHFWSLSIVIERDYREAGIPALSAVAGGARTAVAVHLNAIALVAFSVALAPFAGWAYGAVALLSGAGFLACTSRLRRDPDPKRAFFVFKLSGLHLLVLLAGLVLSSSL
jgi:protoheme IX farnesyltransferase